MANAFIIPLEQLDFQSISNSTTEFETENFCLNIL